MVNDELLVLEVMELRLSYIQENVAILELFKHELEVDEVIYVLDSYVAIFFK